MVAAVLWPGPAHRPGAGAAVSSGPLSSCPICSRPLPPSPLPFSVSLGVNSLPATFRRR